jgi:peptidase E
MKNIIAISGCGFSETGTVTPIETYILSIINHQNPKICFLPTASGDAEGYIEKFYASFKNIHCELSHLSLSKLRNTDIESYLLSQHVIYVGGGNTAKMLTVWKEYAVDKILEEAWNAGVVLCGISAGAMCWFEGGITDSFSAELSPLDSGLGFIKETFTPHCKSENNRIPFLISAIESGFKSGYAVDDDASLHFSTSGNPKVISLNPDHKAYYVNQNGRVTLEPSIILK